MTTKTSIKSKPERFPNLALVETAMGGAVHGDLITTETGDKVTAPRWAMDLLAAGWAIKTQLADLEARLDQINKELLKELGTGQAVTIPGLARATLVERLQVKITDPQALQAALGDRYPDLVRERISYAAEPRLLELATAGDEPLRTMIQAALSVTSSTSVIWRAEK